MNLTCDVKEKWKMENEMGLSKKKRAKEREGERARGNFLEISANLPNGTLSGLLHMTSQHYEQDRVGSRKFLEEIPKHVVCKILCPNVSPWLTVSCIFRLCKC